jgi:predicted DNA-binding transcriptional regulator AlpA
MISPGQPSFESILRQIVREEVRAALLDLGAEFIEPTPSAVKRPSQPARNPLALTPDEVTQMTGVAVQTLYNWRSESRQGKPVGPRSFKMGHLLRYAEADVNAWLNDLRSR